jgi:hypothetical protein
MKGIAMATTPPAGITSRPPRRYMYGMEQWRRVVRLSSLAFAAATTALFMLAAAAGAASASTGGTQPSFAAAKASHAVTASAGHGAAASCTGNRRASAVSRDVAEVFFYSSAGCIGSVTEYVRYTTRSCKDWHIRIYHGNNTRPEVVGTLRHVCKPAGTYKSTDSFHKAFPRPVKVCAGATNTPGYPCKTVA